MISTKISNSLLLLVCLVFYPSFATALNQAEIVQGLEALGDFEAAYPLAVDVAQQQNDYRTWRELADKYREYDQNSQAYLAAWQAAQHLNLEQAYRDFLKLRSQSPLNAQAIHAVYQLTRKLDTIQAYLRFMNDFSNTPEAVQALLRVHEIAFQRAKKKHDPEVYDAFVQTFTGAKQIPQVIKLAYTSEQASLKAEINGDWYNLLNKFYVDENRERVARRVFNQARDAEKNNKLLAAERKYRLLDEWEAFKDTKAYTEHLDRQERLDYRQRQAKRAKQRAQQIETLRKAVVETVKNQHAALRQEVRLQGKRMEEALLMHNKMLKQQFSALGQQLDATNQRMDRKIGQVYDDMGNALNQVRHQVNAQVGAISNAISAQTAAMQQAAAHANYQQQQLFDKAKEEQRWQSQKNRRCAAELARKGKYGFWSSCP